MLNLSRGDSYLDLLYRLSSLEPSANLSRDAITEILNLQKQIEEQRDKYKEEIEKLQAELIGVAGQLAECNELLIDVKDIFQDKIFLLNINDSCFSRIRRWNNDSQKYIDKYFKDKQGEE